MSKFEIEGAGSSSKKPKQPPPAREAANTLRSRSMGRILDLVGYGPVKGPVDGLKSVFLEDTPVQNPDGTLNFEGIDMDFVNGDPDQAVIPGFRDISNPREISSEVKYSVPIIRTLLNNEADAVVVTVRVPALVSTDLSSGDTNPASLPLSIQVLDNFSNTVASVSDTISGKNTSPYDRSYRLDIKGGTGPYSVKVSRLNEESDVQTLRNGLQWAYLTEVIDTRQSYPNCAMFGISVDAELFGSTIPSRKYLMDLSIVKIPSNYDPYTRAYTGFWDGTFKDDWTDNPAWCYYDLATHPVIGAGLAEVNKWALYEIAKYCDELVPNGYGGMEPRFTCNTLFTAPEDAIIALNTLSSVFRGMTYWGSNTVEPVADMPGPIRKIITPSDVMDGEFIYQGTSLADRHSVAVVMWNDPEDRYESKPEMVEDPDSIELLGWRELQITAVACTSRGQARRLGLWALYSERAETQTISFTVPAKHADFRPGDFFEVQDPYRAGARLGGKILEVSGRNLTLDAVPAEASTGWKITVETEEGGLEQLTVSMVAESVVTVTSPPTRPVVAGGSFALSSATISSQVFRVAAVIEQESSTYSVTATAHDPRKYVHIEQGLKLPEIPTSFVPTGRLEAPKNLSAETYTYWAGGTEHQGVTIGWTAPDDARVEKYILEVRGPDDLAFKTVHIGPDLSFDLPLVTPGILRYRVRAFSEEWGHSAWAESNLEITNLLTPKQPTGLLFRSTSNTVTVLPQFSGVNAEFEFWRSSAALSLELIESNASYLGTGTFFIDNKLNFDTLYYYYVRGTNLYGKSGWVPGQTKTTADVDDILDVILKEQQDSTLGQWFKGEIDKISGGGIGSVNDRIGSVDSKFDGLVTGLENVSDALKLQITDLQGQLSELTEAPLWDALHPLYEAKDLTQWEGKLYTALEDIPLGVEPGTDPRWEKIGDFASLSDAISDLSLRVQKAEVDVVVLDDLVTPMVSDLSSMSARWREWDAEEDGYLEGALEAWDVRADFTQEVIVRANEAEALSQRITGLSTSLGDLGSSLTILEQSFTSEMESIATSITELEAQMGDGIEAAILAERSVRVSAEEAIASSVEALEVTVNEDITAALLTESQVRADEVEALSTRLDTTQASVEDVGVSVQQVQQAQATTTGDLNAMWGVKLQINSRGEYVTAGIGLGIENDGGVLQSSFAVQADKFTVVNGVEGSQQVPFAVSQGQVIIRSAFIGDATITMAKIGGNLYSTNYVAGVSGWMLKRDGSFEINSPVSGQGRILINNKGMRVYDANNRIRVKIGDLT
jgi:predicted phage tail protein